MAGADTWSPFNKVIEIPYVALSAASSALDNNQLYLEISCKGYTKLYIERWSDTQSNNVYYHNIIAYDSSGNVTGTLFSQNSAVSLSKKTLSIPANTNKIRFTVQGKGNNSYISGIKIY